MKKTKFFLVEGGSIWVLLALVVQNCLPLILFSRKILKTQEIVSNSLNVYSVLAFLISALIFPVFFIGFFGSEKKITDAIKCYVKKLPFEVIWIAGAYAICLLVSDLINANGIFGLLIFAGLNALVMTFPVFFAIGALGYDRRIAVKNNTSIILMILLTNTVMSIAMSLVGALVAKGLKGITFSSYLVINLIVAITGWLFFMLGMWLVEKKLSNRSLEENETVKNNKIIFKAILSIVSLAAIVGEFVFSLNQENSKKGIDDPAEVVVNSFRDWIEIGDEHLKDGDYIYAQLAYDTAEAEMYAFAATYEKVYVKILEEVEAENASTAAVRISKSYTSDDPINYMQLAKEKNAGDEWVQILDLALGSDYKANLKSKFNNGKISRVEYETLYDLMKKDNDPEMKDFIKYRINNLNFDKMAFSLEDIDEEDIRIILQAVVAGLQDIEDGKMIDAYKLFYQEEKVNDKVVEKAIDIVEEYPENAKLLSEALELTIAASDLYKNPKLIDKIRDLIVPLMDGMKEEDILKYKEIIVEYYASLNASNRVFEFLENTYPEISNSDISTILMYAYIERHQYDEALEEAKKLIEGNTDNVYAYAFCAIRTLQYDVKAALEYALELAKIIDKNDDNKVEAENLLFTFTQYLYGYYSTPSSICPWKYYNEDMDEECEKLVNSNETLMLFVNACEHYIRHGNDEKREEGIKYLNEVISKNDSISSFYLMRGYILYDSKKYDGAISDFNKAIELGSINPLTYMYLGYAYEDSYDFANALKAYEKSKQMAESQDYNPSYNSYSLSTYLDTYIGNCKHYLAEYLDGKEVDTNEKN